MSMMIFIDAGDNPIPYYTCKHCKKRVWFLIHVGRFWKCKECAKR